MSGSADRWDVFLSHSHEDAERVEHLATRLRGAGVRVWLDRWNLIPGTEWQPEMARGLEEARTCAVCLGDQTPTGWFEQEVQKALNRRVADESFRVIPVLLPGATAEEVGDFLELRTWVSFSELDDERAFHLLLSGIKGIKPGRWRPDAESEIEDESTRRLKDLRSLTEQKLVDKDVAKEAQRRLLFERLRIS